MWLGHIVASILRFYLLVVLFCFLSFLFFCLFVSAFILFYFILGGASCNGRGQIKRDREVSGIRIQDVESTKNQ